MFAALVERYVEDELPERFSTRSSYLSALNKYIRPNLVPGHIIQRLLKAADKEQVSIEIFGELVKGLREICDGIHILPVGAEERVGTYLNVLRE